MIKKCKIVSCDMCGNPHKSYAVNCKGRCGSCRRKRSNEKRREYYARRTLRKNQEILRSDGE